MAGLWLIFAVIAAAVIVESLTYLAWLSKQPRYAESRGRRAEGS